MYQDAVSGALAPRDVVYVFAPCGFVGDWRRRRAGGEDEDDAATAATWRAVRPAGTPPSARHGARCVARGAAMFVGGGFAAGAASPSVPWLPLEADAFEVWRDGVAHKDLVSEQLASDGRIRAAFELSLVGCTQSVAAARERRRRRRATTAPPPPPPTAPMSLGVALERCGLSRHAPTFVREEIDDLELTRLLTRGDMARLGLTPDEGDALMRCVEDDAAGVGDVAAVGERASRADDTSTTDDGDDDDDGSGDRDVDGAS